MHTADAPFINVDTAHDYCVALKTELSLITYLKRDKSHLIRRHLLHLERLVLFWLLQCSTATLLNLVMHTSLITYSNTSHPTTPTKYKK